MAARRDDDVEGPRGLDRLRRALFEPAPEPAGPAPEPAPPPTVEELDDQVRFADDRERLIGLLAAPFAAGIGMLVISALITNDPKNHHSAHYVNPTIYHELLIVLLVLSVAMLAAAWFRKRLYLGIATALYGLAIFNLHYWGFGVPFIMVAAWLLVRSYRLQRDLRQASGGPPGRGLGSSRASPARAPQSRRYTPPAPTPTRPPQ
ncbi:MAG: hypothetical protein ACYC0E_12015, partial [Acidimicrobiales bacterium]